MGKVLDQTRNENVGHCWQNWKQSQKPLGIQQRFSSKWNGFPLWFVNKLHRCTLGSKCWWYHHPSGRRRSQSWYRSTYWRLFHCCYCFLFSLFLQEDSLTVLSPCHGTPNMTTCLLHQRKQLWLEWRWFLFRSFLFFLPLKFLRRLLELMFVCVMLELSFRRSLNLTKLNSMEKQSPSSQSATSVVIQLKFTQFTEENLFLWLGYVIWFLFLSSTFLHFFEGRRHNENGRRRSLRHWNICLNRKRPYPWWTRNFSFHAEPQRHSEVTQVLSTTTPPIIHFLFSSKGIQQPENFLFISKKHIKLLHLRVDGWKTEALSATSWDSSNSWTLAQLIRTLLSLTQRVATFLSLNTLSDSNQQQRKSSQRVTIIDETQIHLIFFQKNKKKEFEFEFYDVFLTSALGTTNKGILCSLRVRNLLHPHTWSTTTQYLMPISTRSGKPGTSSFVLLFKLDSITMRCEWSSFP